jgi:MFS superfamily sulfate permease-like transporter
VLFLGTLPGPLLTVALSTLGLLSQLSRPTVSLLDRLPGIPVFASVDRNPTTEADPDIMIVRPDAALMGIIATWTRDELKRQFQQRAEPPRLVILDLDFSSDLDIMSLDVLAKLDKYLAEQRSRLWLANVHAGVRDMLDRAESVHSLGRIPRYRSVDDARAAFRAEASDRS